MNAEQKKLELAKKVLPHLVDPYGRGPAGVDAAGIALLTSASKASVEATLKRGLAKLGSRLRSMGVDCVADLIPTRRPAPGSGFSNQV